MKQIQIEPTTRCNYKCAFCTRSGYPPERIGDMKAGQFSRIVNQLLPELQYVKLQGMGEPVLCPDLVEMLSYAHSVNLRTEVITNGSIFCLEAAEFINVLGISMSAGTKESYQRLTGADKFEEVLANTYEYAGLIPFVWWNFVATKENLNELETLIGLAPQHAIRYINVQPAQCWLTKGEAGYAEHKALGTAIDLLPGFRRQAFEKGVTLHVVPFEKRAVCVMPEEMPFVTWDGWLTPCCLRPDMRVYNFGNVLTEGFESILKSDKYQSFITSCKEGRLPELCGDCTY